MLKMSPDGSHSVWIRRLTGDFAERRSVTLLQGFCCCCCCVQAPVNAACGLVSGLLLPAAGPLRATRPIPWPLRLRIAGAGLIIGAAQGTTALFMWPQWADNLAVYVGSGALLAIVGGVLVARAWRADRWHRATLGLAPRYGRVIALGAALGFALGSFLVSAVHAYDHTRFPPGLVPVSVVASAALGMWLGRWLVKRDERSAFLPQPHLARTLGGLIGANLAVVLTAILCSVVDWWPEVHPPWTLAVLLGCLVVAAVWSAAVCVAKARQGGVPAQRIHSALVVATDGLVGAAAVFVGLHIASNDPGPYWSLAALSLAVVGLVVWTLLARRGHHAAVRSAAEGAQVPRCLHCDYNLTGLTSTRCPECGESFDADVIQRLARAPVFPITFWHPLSTSPIGGALVGAIIVLLVSAIAVILGW
jgi:hypothetical protein